MNGENILNHTFFTDEVWFHLSGYVNTQNSRTWATENPHETFEKPLHDQKIGVWCAVSRSRIIGPIFFDSTVNSNRYIKDIFVPFCEKLTALEKQKHASNKMAPLLILHELRLQPSARYLVNASFNEIYGHLAHQT